MLYDSHQGRDVLQVNGTVGHGFEDDEVFYRRKGELEVAGGNAGATFDHFPFKRQQSQ